MPLDVFTNSDNVTILGPVSISTDPVTGQGGNLTVNGTFGGGQSSSAATIASSGTITTSGVRIARVTDAGAVTAVVLQTGTVAGQELTVINENTTGSNTITMAASGTSNVADGTSTVISGLRCAKFVWDSSTSLWYHTI